MGLNTVPVFEIEHRLQGQTAPKDATVAPADPGGVALALKGGEPPLALEARAAPLAEGMHLHGVKRPGRYLLDGEGVQMVTDPAAFGRGARHGVQVVLLEAVRLAAAGERQGAHLAFGKLPCGLVCLGLPHEIQTPQGFLQAGVVQVPRRIQAHLEDRRIVRRGPQGEFVDEARSRCSHVVCWLSMYCLMMASGAPPTVETK